MIDAATFPRPRTETSTAPRGPARTVTVTGELDMVTADAMARPIHEAISARPTAVVLDLTPLTFFGAAGITVVLAAHDHARSLDVGFTVVCGRRILRVLVIAGVHELVEVHSSTRAALHALESRGAAAPSDSAERDWSRSLSR